MCFNWGKFVQPRRFRLDDWDKRMMRRDKRITGSEDKQNVSWKTPVNQWSAPFRSHIYLCTVLACCHFLHTAGNIGRDPDHYQAYKDSCSNEHHQINVCVCIVLNIKC